MISIYCPQLILCGQASTACSDSNVLLETLALLTSNGSKSDEEMPRVCILTDGELSMYAKLSYRMSKLFIRFYSPALRFDPSEEYVDGILDSLQQMGAELCTTIDIVLE